MTFMQPALRRLFLYFISLATEAQNYKLCTAWQLPQND